MDQQVNNYIHFYHAQAGGRLPVFHAQRQAGDGIGDVLKGFFSRALPFIMPVVKGALNTFMTTAQQGMTEGKSMKEILKSTIKPTLNSALASGVDEFNRSQAGRGRRKRKRRNNNNKKAKRAKVVGPKRKVYKGKRRSAKSKSRTRKINFKTNF